MTAATDLWAAVVVSYDNSGLVTLTNIRDRSQTAITTAVGEDAALGVLNLWPAFAQVDYDATDNLHIEVAKLGTIAILWRRGGSATTIEQVKWDEVFSPDGLISKVKRTGPRGRQGPKTNSNLTQPSGLTSAGGRKLPWSHEASMPLGIMPSDRSVNSD